MKTVLLVKPNTHPRTSCVFKYNLDWHFTDASGATTILPGFSARDDEDLEALLAELRKRNPELEVAFKDQRPAEEKP